MAGFEQECEEGIYCVSCLLTWWTQSFACVELECKLVNVPEKVGSRLRNVCGQLVLTALAVHLEDGDAQARNLRNARPRLGIEVLVVERRPQPRGRVREALRAVAREARAVERVHVARREQPPHRLLEAVVAVASDGDDGARRLGR